MEKKKILVVDDEIEFTKLLKLNLEETGKYEVETENKGLEGLIAAKRFKPDLILLDVSMPDLGGDEVAHQLKKDAGTKNIPVLFLTAVIKKTEADACDGVIGGYPFIAKPVSIEELIDNIERNIGK